MEIDIVTLKTVYDISLSKYQVMLESKITFNSLPHTC